MPVTPSWVSWLVRAAAARAGVACPAPGGGGGNGSGGGMGFLLRPVSRARAAVSPGRAPRSVPPQEKRGGGGGRGRGRGRGRRGRGIAVRPGRRPGADRAPGGPVRRRAETAGRAQGHGGNATARR